LLGEVNTWPRQLFPGQTSRYTPFPQELPLPIGIYGRKRLGLGQTYFSVWREFNQTLRVVENTKGQVRAIFLN
jgi:hypothetical protein